jgi:TPR repeat protein
VPNAARRRGASLVSRHACLVCSSNTARPSVKGIIGRSIKKHANDVAEIHDEALFNKDPPPKEDCPICFLPMSAEIISCISLPPATIMSVPVYDFMMSPNAAALLDRQTEEYYSCCGKSVCKGCTISFNKSGNIGTCPHCKAEKRMDKTDEEWVAELMKRVEVNNDACAMCVIARYYHHGAGGLQQDKERAKKLWTQAAELGSSDAHFHLGRYYDVWGDSKKSKFHYETAAMAGYDDTRFNLGYNEYHAGNVERAVKHWIIAASSGNHRAM